MSAVVKKAPKAKKVSLDHPPYADMIKHAVKELKERNGSSRQAIVKYVKSHYKVDEKAEAHIRRALVSGIKSAKLVHTKGAGASGSFKLAEKAAKVTTPKHTKPAKKATTPKKPKSAKKATPKSAKKATKSPKPKALKPKKTPKKAKTIKPKKPVVKKTPKKVIKK